MREWYRQRQKHAEAKCPACAHLLECHEAGPLRRLVCMDCPCDVKVKWRYAWAVCLMWMGQLGVAS